MLDSLKTLAKQPYWVIALIVGAILVVGPTVTIDKDHWATHAPTTMWPVAVGIALLAISVLAFAAVTISTQFAAVGLDMSRVKREGQSFRTIVNGCELVVFTGRLESIAKDDGVAVVLPCNEYFDDRCVEDTRSALGAFVHATFAARGHEFARLMRTECEKKLGPGIRQQKTNEEMATSYGAGRCLFLPLPMEKPFSIALIATTTQRPEQGLESRISYSFDGIRDLARIL